MWSLFCVFLFVCVIDADDLIRITNGDQRMNDVVNGYLPTEAASVVITAAKLLKQTRRQT